MGRHSGFVRIAVSAALAGACLVGSATNARAGGDATAADTFFSEGLAAMKRNDFAVACEAFSQSNKADPSQGTQINLAICYEKQKKWASAWSMYNSAAALAQARGDNAREKVAADAAAKLEPKIHHMVVSVKEPLTDLVVKRDGVEVSIALAGKEVPLPVDPGEHTLEVSARGKKPWSKTITIADNASTDRIEVPKLENAPVETPASGTPGAASGAGTEYHPPVIVTSDGSGQRTVGIVVAGAGVLAGLAGIGVFVLAKDQASKRDHWRQEASTATDPKIKSKYESSANEFNTKAGNDQLIAIILGAGAGVLVATGAVLYFTAPKGGAKPTTGKPALVPVPIVGSSEAGFGLAGTF